MTVDTIIIIAGSVLIAALLINNIVIRLKNKRLFIAGAQAEIDRLAVYEQVQEILQREAERSEQGDGFIRFMSESREWAFEYIEAVQKDLYLLKDFSDTNGVAPKTVAQANELNKIVSRLLDHLPKDEKKDKDV